MTQAVSIPFGKNMILLGDGESSETFSWPCGLDNLTMQVNINTQNTPIPDCTDPDLPAWIESTVTDKQIVLTGSGLLDRNAMATWQDWWFTQDSAEKNVRWFRDLTLAQGGGYFQAAAILSSYQEQAQRGQKWQVSITIMLNGKPTWTDAVA